ncbi:MAG TPA: PDR/VanB family oxidoreductase [Pseudolabrys sp.]
MADVAELTKTEAGRAALPETREVIVRALRYEAPGVLSLELVPTNGKPLPPFEPGAHIDLHLPGNIMRQYSLCGDPNDTSRYRVGIRSVSGGLSSQFVHRKLRPGEVIKVSAPRNNFPLIDADRYLFVAGGIGVTPLIPMMQAASARNKPWTLLYCNKRDTDAPFLDEIRALGGTLSLHSSEAGTRLDVQQRLGQVEENTVVYCCGPERLMTAVEEATAAWPADTVRFEWFTPRSRPADEVSGSFEVVCEQSGLTVTVPPEKSVLEALNDAGIPVPCSCQQGICGTCEVRVIDGEVDHRDSILSSSERAANQTMMTCVSRAKGARLVLDI